MAASAVLLGQPAPPSAQNQSSSVDGITRNIGLEPTAHIAYALISVQGKLIGSPYPAPPPRLSAQCTQESTGKLKFELLADFGALPEPTFHPPWKPSPGDLYPPNLPKLQVTMDFLGYTHVKPIKRSWEMLQEPAGEMRYATPGLRSSNMEQIMFYLQYLRALPTVRLTASGKGTIEFETAKWQQAIKAEPLCGASGL